MQDEDTNKKDSINKTRKASPGKGYDPGLENFQDFTVMEGLPDNKGDDLYSKRPPKDDGFEKPKETSEDWSKVNVGGFAKSQEVRTENAGPDNLNISASEGSTSSKPPPVQNTIIDQDPVIESGAADDTSSSSVDGDFIDFTLDEGVPPTGNADTIAEDKVSKADNEGDVNLPARYGADSLAEHPDNKNTQHSSDEGGAIARRHTEIKAKAQEAMAADDGERKNRLGDRLVGMGIITPDQLNVALQEKKITGKMIGEVMVDLGFIDEETLTAVLAEDAGFEVFDPKQTIVDGDALALVEKSIAQKHKILPISMDEKHLYVAMSDPYDVLAMDTLRRYVPKGLSIKPVVTTATVISDAIDAAYGYASSINDILKELEEGQHQDVASLDEQDAFSHPIVRLVNALVIDAVKLGVSDLHFEPEENFVRLRYRLDGVLFTAQILHKQHWNGISQRLKLMAEMNIADKLSAQDGRFGLNAGGKEVDFRVSSLPTVHGENIVLRVLDKSSSIMPMEKLGFSPENMKKIKDSQSKPEGIIIVTGPTGSGKSTSLYSMLNEINDVEINIQTLEDPVEYSLPMIRQTHVREGILEFADGIKALLRQDPDIIFIGEIRDKTTAEMALKAAMTGHQVYTTLHTNDSFGAIPRLLDLGLKPGMIAGAIIAVFAQRLTRRLCENCKEEYRPSSEECRILAVNSENPPRIFKARQGGCDICAGQGYKGRVAVAEVLTFDEDMDELLARGESKAELKIMAEKKGFKNMRDDGILKVLDGLTDLAALSRVVDIRR